MNIVIGTVFLVALALWLWRLLPDGDARETALREAIRLGRFIFPRITVALVGAGFFAHLLPADRIEALFGSGTGLAGLVLASALGPLTPGGPFICFAVAAAGLQAGAATGAVMAYVTSWSLFALTKTLAYELPLLGRSFVGWRVIISAPMPILVGMLAGMFEP